MGSTRAARFKAGSPVIDCSDANGSPTDLPRGQAAQREPRRSYEESPSPAGERDDVRAWRLSVLEDLLLGALQRHPRLRRHEGHRARHGKDEAIAGLLPRVFGGKE